RRHRGLDGHPTNEHRHRQRDREPQQGGEMNPNPEYGDGAQQHDHGQGGDYRGKKRVPQRVVILQPMFHGSCGPSEGKRKQRKCRDVTEDRGGQSTKSQVPSSSEVPRSKSQPSFLSRLQTTGKGIRGCPALRHSNTPSLRDVLAQPVQVTFVPRGNRQYDELRSVVWMLGNNEL